MFLQQASQFFVSGVTSGSIYALIALGFCLIQNATGLVNIAQGEIVMLGAMVMATLHQGMGLPMPAALALAICAGAGAGLLLEWGPIRRSRSRDVLTLVLITVGMSITYRGAAMEIWGKGARSLAPLGGDNPILFMRAAILPQALWILGISSATVALLYFFFQRTLTGKAMRAAADNPTGAVLIGISVHRIVALAFGLSGALGALAGILVAPLAGMSYDAGLMYALKGFAAAILGGYGSTLGAVVGGLLLGILEAMGAGFISSAYKDAIAFVILLGILFVRPSGLFGSAQARRL